MLRFSQSVRWNFDAAISTKIVVCWGGYANGAALATGLSANVSENSAEHLDRLEWAVAGLRWEVPLRWSSVVTSLVLMSMR